VKLQDILTEVNQDTEQDGYKYSDHARNALPWVADEVKKARSMPDHEKMGTGKNAYVYRNNNPHQLDNVTRISSTLDGSVVYLKSVMRDSSLHNNPFFPRVLGMDKTPKDISSFKLERLYESSNTRITGDDKELFILSAWERYFTVPPPVSRKYPVVSEMVEVINDVCHGDDVNIIRDTDLAEAIAYIQKLVKANPSLLIDLHDGNVMWRITGNMPQLVITDPLHLPTEKHG
jgi:hypothetical protein